MIYKLEYVCNTFKYTGKTWWLVYPQEYNIFDSIVIREENTTETTSTVVHNFKDIQIDKYALVCDSPSSIFILLQKSKQICYIAYQIG